MTKIAVVTGGNRGVGFTIVKGLCEKFNGKVYLTARDQQRGKDAVNKLKEFGLKPLFHQLDINDQRSIDKLRDYLKETEGGIDLLINCASVTYPTNTSVPFNEQAEVTVQVNYFSTLHVCQTLFPILRPQARVVNLTSTLGHLSQIPSPQLRSKLGSASLTIEKLNDLMCQFISVAKEGKHLEQGWGISAYAVSKVGISALTIIQQRDFDNEIENRKISVNSACVDTNINNQHETLTPEESSSAALYLAIKTHDLHGQYMLHYLTVLDWYASSLPNNF